MLHYTHSTLYLESVALSDIAKRTATPVYVYSAGLIRANYRAYDESFGPLPHDVCYAVKANSSLAILSLLAKMGSGFDIVSAGELFRVLKAGGDPSRVVFSGVGKTAGEVDYALAQGIHSFNCESEAELALIDAMSVRRGVKADFALRVNPDVDAATHPYISTGLRDHKFGIDIAEAPAVYERARRFSNLTAAGVSCHIGSQLLDTDPVMEAVDKVLRLAEELRAAGLAIRHVDFGGGLGVAYKAGDETPQIREFVAALKRKVEGRDLAVMVEPGRSIVGPAGVLLTRVLYRKKTGSKEFVVVDAAMNDLLRPSLYKAHHEIIPLRQSGHGTIVADVVGPVCETGDFLARDREVANVAPGDLLAVCTAGAYGFVLASNYNSRTRPPEALVDGADWRLIRARESYDDLVHGETV
ncbi:MAG: diaminopimelate decarboxylase [Acidobacteria bacterium]|nr:diaminopimelate decarboxylase [Acidobacteriota bacterium]MBI3472142.1 diaminopimelate decarboxylase [Candidatus Solibacter usitatus]